MEPGSIYLVAFIVIILLLVLFVPQSNEPSTPDSQKNKDPDYLTDQLLRRVKGRKRYYREVYLKSEAWKRKRFVVLRRDNWKCVRCGAPATQVHHKRYAPRNIGKEPIEWLESVCKACHEAIHR